jgi:hypothetical protein
MTLGLPAFALAYAAAVALLHAYSPLGRTGLALAVLLFPAIGWLSNRWFALMGHWLENLRLTALHLLRRGRIEQLRLARQALARDEEQMRAFLVARPDQTGAMRP